MIRLVSGQQKQLRKQGAQVRNNGAEVELTVDWLPGILDLRYVVLVSWEILRGKQRLIAADQGRGGLLAMKEFRCSIGIELRREGKLMGRVTVAYITR